MEFPKLHQNDEVQAILSQNQFEEQFALTDVNNDGITDLTENLAVKNIPADQMEQYELEAGHYLANRPEKFILMGNDHRYIPQDIVFHAVAASVAKGERVAFTAEAPSAVYKPLFDALKVGTITEEQLIPMLIERDATILEQDRAVFGKRHTIMVGLQALAAFKAGADVFFIDDHNRFFISNTNVDRDEYMAQKLYDLDTKYDKIYSDFGDTHTQENYDPKNYVSSGKVSAADRVVGTILPTLVGDDKVLSIMLKIFDERGYFSQKAQTYELILPSGNRGYTTLPEEIAAWDFK